MKTKKNIKKNIKNLKKNNKKFGGSSTEQFPNSSHESQIITIDVGGKIFRTNKDILVENSGYFERLFSDDWNKDGNNILFLDSKGVPCITDTSNSENINNIMKLKPNPVFLEKRCIIFWAYWRNLIM